MAEDHSPNSLANGGAVVAAIAALGFFYFHHEAPLTDLRPTADQNVAAAAAPQTVEARLWQDPFAAIDRILDKSSKQNLEHQCKADPNADERCHSPMTAADNGRTQVLGVLVSGAPYPEDAEQRRRTRYAVLAGLERAGFVPADRRHVGFFLWENTSEPPTSLLGVEASEKQRVPALASAAGNQKCHSSRCRKKATTPSTVTPRPIAARDDYPIVPYEQFENDAQHKIIILWLKEDYFDKSPILTALKLEYFLENHKYTDNKYTFIGPYTSDALKAMANEVSPYIDTKNCITPEDLEKKLPAQELSALRFYSYSASAPDQFIKDVGKCLSLERYFDKIHIKFMRTIATDDTLADGVIAELKRRGVQPGQPPKQNPVGQLLGIQKLGDDLALISEWDTIYGQTLPKTVEQKFRSACERAYQDDPSEGKSKCQTDGKPEDWVHKLTYLRGLDGLLPSTKIKDQDQKPDQVTASDEKQAGTTDFFKLENDTATLERPIGQGQFDYLRRISEELHTIDTELRKKAKDPQEKEDKDPHKTENGRKISAIGILGGDVFDKLLILRALKPEFPDAYFFTTDFDEAYTIKSELPYTRNLIIASGFGPNLAGWLQGDIPPFRDTYETSAFLATQLAVGDQNDSYFKSLDRIDYVADGISDQLSKARLFEVKRTGEFFPFVWTPPTTPKDDESKPEVPEVKEFISQIENSVHEGRAASSHEWLCFNDTSHKNKNQCGNIQPVDREELVGHSKPDDPKPIEKPFPTLLPNGKKGLTGLFAILSAGAFIAAVSTFWWPLFAKWRLELKFSAVCLIAAAAACFFWESLARRLTQGLNYDEGGGEPITFMDGISLWPTVLLRLTSIILAIYFLCRVKLDLNKNLGEIAEDMGLKGSLQPEPGRETTYLDWCSYVSQERWWKRLFWALVPTGIMLVIVFKVFIPTIGIPFYAHRSDLADNAYFATGLLDWVLTQFLIFVVFHATCSCLLFVNKLQCGNKGRPWPDTTVSRYNSRLQLPQTDGFINEWINLDFVARRTRCIGKLIYYPFVLLAILILSRSTVFANFGPSLIIPLIHGISLFIVFACTLMLWLAAKSAHNAAREHLGDGVIGAKQAKEAYFSEQLQILLNRVEQLREGAFAPITQQPLVRACLFPLSSGGLIALIQSGVFPGL
jgi:hypothetical protein